MNINICSLEKYYGNQKVLDIDAVDFASGKITGIYGENGAGKSTLLSVIAGIENNHTGQILYDGKPFSEDIRLKTTMIFQKDYLLKKTVYENIIYPLKIRGICKTEIQTAVNNVKDYFSIDSLFSKKGNELSEGEIQKVLVIRALIFKPKLLLLDEPTSNMDRLSITEFNNIILQYHRHTNSTIVIISHNIEQLNHLCGGIIYMDAGTVVKATSH